MIHCGAVRGIILAMAGLVFLGAGGPMPADRAGAASSPQELLVYYGWPSRINGATEPGAAAAELGRYAFVALGSGVEDPAHGDHAATIQILADPTMAGTYVFGYVNLGMTNGSLPLEEVYRRIDNWQAVGAEAILFDAFGYDFGVTRERQNAAVAYAHALGMPVMANAWFPADAFDAAVDPQYNPQGVPTLLDAGDYFLSESYVVRMGQYPPEELWRAKAEQLATYQARLGFSILSVTTSSAANAYVEEMFFTAWYAAAADGHRAIGWGEYLFSAIDGSAPYRARPAAVSPLPDPEKDDPSDPPPDGGDGVEPPDEGAAPPPEEAETYPPVLCGGKPATIIGTPGDDVLVGKKGPDVIAGLGGNDIIDGLGGDDLICGGSGRDVIRAGAGNDRLWGGPGADRLLGGRGDDLLRGQGGDDLLQGRAGSDRALGGAGFDTCSAETTRLCEA
jgi:hypothetical protein